MTKEDQGFYSRFKTVKDHITIDIQLNEIKDEMIKQLAFENGKIIPKQNREQLIEIFRRALNVLGY